MTRNTIIIKSNSTKCSVNATNKLLVLASKILASKHPANSSADCLFFHITPNYPPSCPSYCFDSVIEYSVTSKSQYKAINGKSNNYLPVKFIQLAPLVNHPINLKYISSEIHI